MKATEQMLKSRKIKEQFNQAHEARKWEQHSYPNYAQKKKPDFIEFGRAYDVSVLVIATNTQSVQAVYQMALDDFFKAKADNFPSWEGLPEIKVNPAVDALRRIVQVAWYAQVPKKYVLTEEQKLDKLDEELWDS